MSRIKILLACLAAASALLAACGEVKTVNGARPKGCRVAPGPSPAQCPLMGNDADWLPPAYVRNATCRCQSTPNSPSANCVRGRLDAALRAVEPSIREHWRQQKAKLYDTGRRDEYDRWVRQTAGRTIYNWHQKAHARCCCAAPLPPYEQWSTAVTVPLDSCSQARALTRFGSCGKTPGRW